MADIYGPERTLDEVNDIYGGWSGYWALYIRASSMLATRIDEATMSGGGEQEKEDDAATEDGGTPA